MSKLIQEKFGEIVIDAVGQFAKADLPTVQNLEQREFSHVSDAQLDTRKNLPVWLIS